MLPLVILGTGTAVGKTFVTAALARTLVDHGHRIAAIKPIESGVPSIIPPSAVPAPETDAGTLAIASNATLPAPNPLYSFPDPMSPHLASRRAATTIEIPAIQRWAATAAAPDTTLILETAGGVFTPLNDTQTNLDLARAFEPATWVLVAPDALGVLHDVTATLHAMRALARAPDHLVLTSARPADASTTTNAAELARLGHGTPIVVPPNDTRPLLELLQYLLPPT